MRVAFAGTPPFAAQSLQALAAAGHDVCLVLSQPDRPSGRGMKLTPSAVSREAAALGLPLFQPATLREPAAQERLAGAAPDVMVVAAYGLLLPPAVLAIPVRGCLNIHASLLPRWRGAAPVQRAILAGDAETGISIMQMEAGLDTGPVLLERRCTIGEDDTAASLTERLSGLGAEAIRDALAGLDGLVPRPQDESQATYAAKLRRDEAPLDWARDNVALRRQVRAFDPFPGAEARIGGLQLKVWSARCVAGDGAPGTLLESDGGLRVACGRGALELEVIQVPGGRRVAARDFVRGRPELAGP